jgi:hypothetical protein
MRQAFGDELFQTGRCTRGHALAWQARSHSDALIGCEEFGNFTALRIPEGHGFADFLVRGLPCLDVTFQVGEHSLTRLLLAQSGGGWSVPKSLVSQSVAGRPSWQAVSGSPWTA